MYGCTSLFIHLPLKGHLGGHHVLKMYKQGCFKYSCADFCVNIFSFLLSKWLRVVYLGHDGPCIFKFVSNCPMVFHSGYTILKSCLKRGDSTCSTPSSGLSITRWFSFFYNFSPSNMCSVVFLMVSICILQMNNELGHLFMCSYAICTIFNC